MRKYESKVRQQRMETLAALKQLESTREVPKPSRVVTTKVTRGSRILFIKALNWVCPICSQPVLNSRQWVVRYDVVMCKSCWTKMLAFIGYKKLPERLNIEWLRVCGSPATVDGCTCRHCVLRRLKECQ